MSLGQTGNYLSVLSFVEGSKRFTAYEALRGPGQANTCSCFIIWKFSDRHEVIPAHREVEAEELSASCRKDLLGSIESCRTILDAFNTFLGIPEEPNVSWHRNTSRRQMLSEMPGHEGWSQGRHAAAVRSRVSARPKWGSAKSVGACKDRTTTATVKAARRGARGHGPATHLSSRADRGVIDRMIARPASSDPDDIHRVHLVIKVTVRPTTVTTVNVNFA
jgi:hypothetical protein